MSQLTTDPNTVANKQQTASWRHLIQLSCSWIALWHLTFSVTTRHHSIIHQPPKPNTHSGWGQLLWTVPQSAAASPTKTTLQPQMSAFHTLTTKTSGYMDSSVLAVFRCLNRAIQRKIAIARLWTEVRVLCMFSECNLWVCSKLPLGCNNHVVMIWS